jgi:hypothetical protein
MGRPHSDVGRVCVGIDRRHALDDCRLTADETSDQIQPRIAVQVGGLHDQGVAFPRPRDPNTGKYRRVRLFVFTLGYSRKSVRLLTWRSSAQIWAELHERAFRRLGGTVRVIVLDYVPRNIIELMCPNGECGRGLSARSKQTIVSPTTGT